MELRPGFFPGKFNDVHLIQLFLAGHGHVPGGDPGLVPGHEILQLRYFLLLSLIGGLQLGLLYSVYFPEFVIIPHIAVKPLVFHMINQVDDTVEEGYVMGNEDEGIFILLQVAFQPVYVLYIQIVGRLVQQQNVRLFQKKLA